MLLGIRRAAKEWGVSRQTLYNKIAAGDISYTKDERGNRQIESSEMVRVFGQPKPPKDDQEPVTSVSQDSQMVDLLREQLEKTEKRLERVESALEEKDRAFIALTESIQENMQLFLEHTKQEVVTATHEPEAPPVVIEEVKPEPEPPQPKKKKGFLGRMVTAAFDLD